MSLPTIYLPIGQDALVKTSAVIDQNGNPLVYSSNQLGAKGGPAAVSWLSSNTAVAQVTSGPGTQYGLITGVSAGTCNITGSYTDTHGNTATVTLSVTVYQPAATSIQVIYPGYPSTG